MAHITRFFHSHVRRAVIAVVVVAALAVGGVAYAVSSLGGSSSPQASPPITSAPTTTPPATPKRPKPVRGQLTAIAPGTWTVRTAAGQMVTVTVTAQTKFGTRKAPATEASFAVGNRIVVNGQQTATTVVATHIALVPVKPAGTPTSTTVPAQAPASAAG